jgi:hypothetical protein
MPGFAQEATVGGSPGAVVGEAGGCGGSSPLLAAAMPDFWGMDVKELKRRVKQFGLKAAGKKAMAQREKLPQPERA